MTKYLIKHQKTIIHHPRIHGQTKKTKILLCGILTKIIMGVGFDYDTKLFGALWVYQTAYKVHTSQTPFQLVYGQETILLIELELLPLCIAL